MSTAMNSKIRECINQINKAQNARELLPNYVEQSMRLHGQYARIRMMMEYYIFYEIVSEGINPYIPSVQDMIEHLNRMAMQVFTEKYTEEKAGKWRAELLSMRQDIMDRMQVLTAYVDCFVVYEYILNRLQYRFEKQEVLPADTEFAQEVMNFIFSSKDTMTINDNLRLVLGQLPMRMTRKHYFDLIRDSISVYKGSDISSLEGFLYMFRTSAMLYRDANQDKYFTEFKTVLEELEQVDFEHIDRDLYQIYAEKIHINASKLTDLSDLYMQIGQLLNELYAIVLTMPRQTEEDAMRAADLVIRGLLELFTQEESSWPGHSPWSEAEEALGTEEDKMAWLGEHLTFAEGRQEELMDVLNIVEAALDEIRESRKEEIESAGLQQDFEHLYQLSMLNSSSVFAVLEEPEESGQVTAEIAEAEAESLITELKEMFQGQNRMLRRAIMAGTVEKLPTFFSSAQEVADYMMHSLNQCDDAAEKYASKQLILELMR